MARLDDPYVSGDRLLEQLRHCTGRSTQAEVIRDALLLYTRLLSFVEGGEKIFVGKDRNGARELTVTQVPPHITRINAQ